MREIKFRKWDAEEQTMISGDNLAFEEYDPLTHLLSQEGIMQYTGLTDRNGKEIYEGDVYQTEDGRDRGVIKYKGCGFYVEWMPPVTFGLRGCLNYVEGGEVIGSIYESPELLKGE